MFQSKSSSSDSSSSSGGGDDSHLYKLANAGECYHIDEMKEILRSDKEFPVSDITSILKRFLFNVHYCFYSSNALDKELLKLFIEKGVNPFLEYTPSDDLAVFDIRKKNIVVMICERDPSALEYIQFIFECCKKNKMSILSHPRSILNAPDCFFMLKNVDNEGLLTWILQNYNKRIKIPMYIIETACKNHPEYVKLVDEYETEYKKELRRREKAARILQRVYLYYKYSPDSTYFQKRKNDFNSHRKELVEFHRVSNQVPDTM